MDLDPDILTLQKFIYLLDDFHYNEFKNHLVKIKAHLSLKLAETIRRRLPGFDTPDHLCKKVYRAAGKTEKQNFNRLNLLTFRLSGNLASNYPEYLHPNIQKIQRLVLDRKLDEANFLNACLFEIAGLINDFQCQIFALQFMSQQAYVVKDKARAQKIDRLLAEAIENQSLFFKIQTTLRTVVYTSTIPKSDKELQLLLKSFELHNRHPCACIRILSQFACQSTRYHLTKQIYTPADYTRIKTLRRDLLNNLFVVFPFLLDIRGSLEYMLLNSPYVNLFAKKTAREYVALSAHYDSLKSWNSYLNFGELNLIAVHSTMLLSLYHHKVHLSNYQQVITAEHKAILNDQINKCKTIINHIPQRHNKVYEERSVKMLYSALLILSGGKHIQEGLNELEMLLVNYQQISFKASTDSIFLCLMVGYFSIKDYDKCSSTFKRYLKSIKGKLLYEGNHIKIHAYYYIAQWLATQSRQYPAKLSAMLNKYGTGGSQRTVWELTAHFNLPVELGY